MLGLGLEQHGNKRQRSLDCLSLSWGPYFATAEQMGDSLGISLQNETVPMGGICHAFDALPGDVLCALSHSFQNYCA